MDEELSIIGQSGGDQTRKRQAWGRIIEHWRHSGLGATAFCRGHGLGAKAFFRWRSKLAAPPVQPAAGFVELVADRATAPPGQLEIHLEGCRILLPCDGSEAQLAMVLRRVKEAAC
jgi:hypothetical protein